MADGVTTAGCAGSRHHSVALVELLAADLHVAGLHPEVTHLHMHLPRVLHTAAVDG